MALRIFFPGANVGCFDLRLVSRSLAAEAPGIEEGAACRRIAARHEGWARQLPERPGALWAFVRLLDTDSRLALFAHCVALGLDAVQCFAARVDAVAQADDLATAARLDMSQDWTATAASYLGRVTKARLLEAVGEAAGEAAASRLSTCKKPDMIAAAEPLLAGTGWLPALLCTHAEADEAEAHDQAAA